MRIKQTHPCPPKLLWSGVGLETSVSNLLRQKEKDISIPRYSIGLVFGTWSDRCILPAVQDAQQILEFYEKKSAD